MNNYQPVIGLEIHAELKTVSKMFCQCPANWFGKPPNSQTCPVCLALPGALPVPNQKAIEWTILIAKALNCHINKSSKFDRKHYFYPDLPKGYQISQYDEPIAGEGRVKKFGITRVHLEEDTGKLIHKDGETLIDFNRSGVPLVEIVTEPDFDNSDDVKNFLEELQTILRYLEVSDCDMEKGSMRLEPNISVRKNQSAKSKVQNEIPKYKVEIKNINSFKFVKRAIDYEIVRQTEILKDGKTPIQETRGYDEVKGVTFSQRTKEESHDYRYFPEPDIPPLIFTDKFLSGIKVPELPQAKLERYVKTYATKYEDAFIITREKNKSQFFESVMGEIQKAKGTEEIREIGSKIASMIVNKKISTNLSISEFIIRSKVIMRPVHLEDTVYIYAIKKVISENETAVMEFKKGKVNVIMFLVGQVMKEMKGAADAQVIKNKLIHQLTERN